MTDASPTAITVVPATTTELKPETVAESWWAQYRANASHQLSPIALEVLEMDARYIVERALPRKDAQFDTNGWSEDDVRTGMVIGSVQSGKTASMLAVASMALDQNVDIVILLAGTRVGLWLQTYERMLDQLDGTSQDTAYTRSEDRLILPQPEDILNSIRSGPAEYLKRSKATLAERRGIPIIIVVPKIEEHLLHVSRLLKSVFDPSVLEARGQSTTMLVLDDEADDASVLDSAVSDKITPRYIAALWSGDHRKSSSRHPKLLATYVAYTATPQANYLQDSHNPLAPRHFSAALRVAGQEGEVLLRSLTYREPSGVTGYYCGGDLYYESTSFRSGSLAVSWPNPVLQNDESAAEFLERIERLRWEMLSNALRSFLVGAAVRLLVDKKRYSDVVRCLFETEEALKEVVPAPHTMMFHPSARKDAHFAAAEDVARWSRSLSGMERFVELPEDDFGSPIVNLDAAGLKERLQAEESEWQSCFHSFEASRSGLATFPLSPYVRLEDHQWEEVKVLLVDEVFPNVQLKILNSDPSADHRPSFQPVCKNEGWEAPIDLLTIFVAGNILSRGLTVEGLTTSLFLRSSFEPAADTQMQMQRWFGYRGRYLPLCRIFMLEDQLHLFRQYNVRDKALKTLVMQRMTMTGNYSAQTLILEGMQFSATSKVDTRKVPLSPGPSPQLLLVERTDPVIAENNVKVLLDNLKTGSWEKIDPARDLGLIRREPVGLLEVAQLLETLQYSHHDPSLEENMSQRWVSLQHSLGVADPLFRPPGLNPMPYAVRPQSCPYAIAAYLRLWSSLIEGVHAPGFHPTDKPDLPWSQLDNKLKPAFFLAVRSGDHTSSEPDFRERGIGAMVRGIGSLDRLNTLWGSRGYGSSGYHGDQLIDYHFHKRQPVPKLQGGETWRPRGHPGLVLFHVIKDDHGGRDMVTLGMGLPHGGPDHIAALRR